MDFSLTREQELIRKMIRAFTENEVKPIAAVIVTGRTNFQPRTSASCSGCASSA